MSYNRLELSDEAMAVIGKVEKLMALANNNDNEHQAQAAAAKAMELLAAYNLDMAAIGAGASQKNRADKNMPGGLYQWQRDLWEAVAQLNFCLYWPIKRFDPERINQYKKRKYGIDEKGGYVFEHRVVGRQENVIGSRVMAEYLEQTIERLTREKMGDPKLYWKPEATAFREGMASRLCTRLRDERKRVLEEDERKMREAAARANHPGAAPGTNIILASVIKSEEDANYDYLYGEGAAAARDARRAAAQAESERLLREQREWELANPEEAAEKKRKDKEASDKWYEEWRKKEEKRAKRRKGSSYRYRMPTAAEKRRDSDHYIEGYHKADSISLNRQVDVEKKRRLT